MTSFLGSLFGLLVQFASHDTRHRIVSLAVLWPFLLPQLLVCC
jgi:hypothetical protein